MVYNIKENDKHNFKIIASTSKKKIAKKYARSVEGINELLFWLLIEFTLRDHRCLMSLSFVVVKGGLGDRYIDGSSTTALIVATIVSAKQIII